MPYDSQMSDSLQNCCIRGGRVLRSGGLTETSLFIANGVITKDTPDTTDMDATGLLVLPGIVDLHGDAFERSIMPRPGVSFPLPLALMDADRQMVANGITTAFHGLTVSWEPGLRDLASGKAFVEALASVRSRLLCDTRLHVRWETFALDAMDDVLGWLAVEEGAILAFNDHTAKTAEGGRSDRKIAELADRSGLNVAAYMRMVDDVWERRDAIPAAIERMAKSGTGSGAILLAHDERNPEDRRYFRALGSAICEFPLTRETAEDARAQDEAVILGAPNVVRGGSHTGAMDATQAVKDGLCTVLASDYYYPAPMEAAFILAGRGICDLPAAWALVSEHPATAVGLTDRGTFDAGKRADIVLVDPSGAHPRAVAVFSAGRLVYAARGFGGSTGCT